MFITFRQSRPKVETIENSVALRSVAMVKSTLKARNVFGIHFGALFRESVWKMSRN